jgi:hypothetical protein
MSQPPVRPLQIRVTRPGSGRDSSLQLPSGDLRHGRCQFHVNPDDGGSYDFWIVIGFAYEHEWALVPPGNTLFICGEPPAKKLFPRGFYRQFAHVIDTHHHSRHPNLVIHAPCLGWWVGGDYAQQAALACPPKQNRVGVVCSSTAQTPGQRQRLRFLAELKKQLPDDIVHFGRGFQPVADKMDAILPYRFQLVLENSRSPHYWTEKLIDAYIGWAHPLYVGCPNLADYFPAESFTALDPNYVAGSVATIRRLLSTPDTPAASAALAEARRRVLDEYNVGVRCARLVESLHRPGEPVRTEIRTYKAFRFLDRLVGRTSYPRTRKPAPARESTTA